MICANCGTANEAGRKFCKECASPLSVVCSNCGTANAPDAKFCGECASALFSATTVGSASRPPLAGPLRSPIAERRVVTVLFADLVGFTAFAEERDAEEVRDTLSRYFELATEVVVRYGGVIEKFIGDAVMAVWGAPAAHEDDAERAVRAALELVGAVHMLGPSIQARAGVLTGEAAVTVGATNQGMVAGDLVNTASRLQSVAPPGAVLVGETTFRAAHRAIAFEEVGQHTLKGKASPIDAWRALRVVAERGGLNRAETLEAPFIGRQDELRLLQDLLHATGRERRMRLVSVMGPAGIGKSRLAWELLKYVDGFVEPIYYHSGRSPAYGEGISFWALGEMVRARAELRETDDEATTRARIRETCTHWIADEAERRWVELALLALLGIETGVPSEDLFAAWRTFFERISASGTVVLVFEDFHFADTGLIDFVDHLLDWSKGAPILVITLARPALLEKRADWGAGKRNFHSIVLEPLQEPDMRELITGLAPGLPENATRTIVARADGIPLYAVETVRMLVAEGRLRLEGDGYVPVGDLTSLSIPETLTALIASRLDALDAPERSVVHDAAVLGQSFSLAALSVVSGIEEGALESRLATLVRRELLTRELDPRSPERGQYIFVQALIREVAYSTLARKERKARHLAAARFFETLETDELAGALAGHYLAAHANAAHGAESSALAGQARIALKAAADRAANLGAYDQAVTFLEQALSVATDPAEQADLLERAGEAARTAARYEEAEHLVRRAVEIRRHLGDRLGTARATASLAETLLQGYRDEPALDLLKGAVAEFADLAPDPVVANLGVHLAWAYLEAGTISQAIEAVERVLETAERRELLPIVTTAFTVKGAALGSQGRKREGIALISAAEELARENGLNQQLLRALIVGGYHRGDLDQMAALEGYREGLALARRLGHRNLMLRFINNIGYTGFLAGDWDSALAELEGALAEDLHGGDRVVILCNALLVHVCRGEPVATGIEEAERHVAEIGNPGMRVSILDVEGNAGLAEGRLEESGRAWRELVRLEGSQGPEFLYRAARTALWRLDREAAAADLEALDATGVHGRVVEIRRLTIRAGLAALDGHVAEALARYGEALRGWRELHLPWDEALTSIDMVILVDPTQPEVQAAGASGREILSRLRASPFLARLDAALARPGSADSGDAAALVDRIHARDQRSDVSAGGVVADGEPSTFLTPGAITSTIPRMAIRPGERPLSWPLGAALTFVAAASVLVLEIAAGRLLAPYVGVSLTTYTGIIGAILAGIALGAWLGGRAADAIGPRTLLGPTFMLGGLAAIAAVPIVTLVSALGLGDGFVGIVTMATLAFVAPAAILSAVGPMIVRATLIDVSTSGSIVGRLSAIATVGAITGTLVTGFVLLGLVPTRTLIVVLGGLLVVIGLGLTLAFRGGATPSGTLAIGAVVIGGLALATPSPCDTESTYYCIAVVADRDDMDGRTLILDRLTHAYVDIGDATVVRFGYVQRFAGASGAYLDGLGRPADVLHLGGGGFTFPRYLEATRPGIRQTVLELDPRILEVAREALGFAPSNAITVKLGDARRSIETLPTDSFDLVVGDAFGGLAVPWHLTTTEFLEEVQRVLRPGGMYVMNLIDYPPLGFVKAEAATAGRLFEHVAIIAPPETLAGQDGGNVILVASAEPLDVAEVTARTRAWGPGSRDGILATPAEVAAFVGDATILTDDFAPVDQLLAPWRP